MVDQDPSRLLERFAALAAARPLHERLAPAARDVYLVGGAVRDLMLGSEPRELDLVVEGDVEELIEELGPARRLHGRFGTATVQVNGFTYDLARARRESYSHPGALPTVAPASLVEDLGRRDFTVNAISLAVLGPRRGWLAAYSPGLDDLRAGTMRVLHDASFRDDPTRLLRLARYASRLQFAIEPHTRALAQAAVGGGALETVSGPRLGAELRLLAVEPDPVAALGALGELGVDSALAPWFGLRDPALARRALALLPPDGDRAALAIAAASSDAGPAELARLLERLAFEASQRDAILASAGGAASLAASLQTVALPSQISAAVGRSALEAVALAGALGPAEAARRWLQELRFVRLDIDGADILAAGVAAGPAVGAGLRAALAAKLDGRALGREAELAEALRAAATGR
ncbi:MAG: hypothetical protein ACR2MK_09225 [Solirubrobacteraceae bacterium]